MKSIFTRLVSNKNSWESPSGHSWAKEYQGDPDIPYDKQYGFGHEEWLFNPRYHIDKMQYGYIRGLKSFGTKGEMLPEVYLYTIEVEKNLSCVFYIGKIKNVEPLSNDWKILHPKAAKVFSETEDLIVEVKKSSGDPAGLKRDPLRPNIRFKLADLELLEKPIYLRDFPLDKYKRFQPYRLTNEMAKIFARTQDLFKSDNFKFEPGKARQSEIYSRFTTVSDKTIIKRHTKILEALEFFLKPTYSLSLRNISIEKTRFMGYIADLVTVESNASISIYEVKTSLVGRKNIRESIAQLLDYASHAGQTNINKLVIVAPKKLQPDETRFLASLNKSIKYKIEYWAYLEDEKPLFIKF